MNDSFCSPAAFKYLFSLLYHQISSLKAESEAQDNHALKGCLLTSAYSFIVLVVCFVLKISLKAGGRFLCVCTRNGNI